MKKANFIFRILGLVMQTMMIAIPAIFGAMYILTEVMYDEEWAVVFFIPYCVMLIWKLVKLQIIETKEAKEMLK